MRLIRISQARTSRPVRNPIDTSLQPWINQRSTVQLSERRSRFESSEGSSVSAMDVDMEGSRQDSGGEGSYDLAILKTAGETGRDQLSLGAASSLDSDEQEAKSRANWSAWRETSQKQKKQKEDAQPRVLPPGLFESNDIDGDKVKFHHPDIAFVISRFTELDLRRPAFVSSPESLSSSRKAGKAKTHSPSRASHHCLSKSFFSSENFWRVRTAWGRS
jgi:hypothetical protein